MSNRKVCAVCQSFSHKTLFKFPKDPLLREIWEKKTGITLSSENDTLTRLCHIHFEENQWHQTLATGKVLCNLKENAVPTLYLKEAAPAPDAESKLPPHSTKYVRCAVCYMRCLTLDCVNIFTKDEYYTDFGVALSLVLKLTSRALPSRHCCVDCSSTVINCFETLIDINVSTMLSLRMSTKRNELLSEAKVLKEKSLTEGQVIKIDNDFSKESCKGVKHMAADHFSEPCSKCDGVFNSLNKFSDHFLTHLLFENREVVQKAVAMTQVHDFEIEMGIFDEYVKSEPIEEVQPEKRKKSKKTKKKNRIMEVPDSLLQDYVVEYLDDEFDTRFMLSEKENDLEADQFDSFAAVKSDIVDDYECFNETVDRLDTDFDANLTPNGGEKIKNESFFQVPHSSKVILEESQAEAIIKMQKKRAQKRRDGATESGNRICYMCGITLKNQKTFEVHMERHANPDKFSTKCSICNRRVVNYARHIKSCEKNPVPCTNEGRPRKLPAVTCEVCNKKIAAVYMPKHLRRHEIEKDVEKNGTLAMEKYLETCHVCGKRVKYLYDHHKIHKRKGEMPEPDPLAPVKYDCDECGASFNQRPLLVNHLAIKHGADPRQFASRGVKTTWTCSVCKLVFATYNAIRRHTLGEHNGVGCDLQCEVCGKQYNSKSSYIFHINSRHLNIYKFRCKSCGNYFVEESSYNDHCLYRCRYQQGSQGAAKRKAIEEPQTVRAISKKDMKADPLSDLTSESISENLASSQPQQIVFDNENDYTNYTYETSQPYPYEQVYFIADT